MSLLTVVIPTLDRRDLVLACVESVLVQTRPPDEVVVADNGSRDGTPAALAARFGARARVLCEPRRGVSHARNLGVEAARGDIVAFIDDDARAAPDWLERLERCLLETGALGAGGPAEPDWEAAPPAWLTSSRKALCTVGAFSWEGERRPLRSPREFLIGTNCAFRRELFDSGLRFRQPRAGRPVGMEDVEFSTRAASRGPVYYEPTAVVRHRIPRRKATLAYLAACSFDNGRKQVEAGRPLLLPGWSLDPRSVDAWIGAFSTAGWAWGKVSGS